MNSVGGLVCGHGTVHILHRAPFGDIECHGRKRNLWAVNLHGAPNQHEPVSGVHYRTPQKEAVSRRRGTAPQGNRDADTVALRRVGRGANR